ncbi:hypothetical protein GCM10027176_20850 [Actinoallomurus bryophytorum]|uniref:Uncharacterized protein n=1 Tax=Actinoallomurus bryophytorum TaxID=1490222 RepID=A0A543CKL5_9ACTN|nr:hypothetical protein [Actinoallomurus bryophytorum]TQL97643.1 hypothetical protein FB559_3241 [Actinoallomurus bryophytorum]
MDYDRESLRALASELDSDELKFENSFYLSGEFYNPSGDDFMLDTSYTGAEETPLRDSTYTLELSRAFYSACENGDEILTKMSDLRFGIANAIDQMTNDQDHAEVKNKDEIGTLFKALD